MPQTPVIGNKGAGRPAPSDWIKQDGSVVARVLQVRWDVDKVRGLRMIMSDGSTHSAGGIDDSYGHLDTLALSDNEYVTGVTLKDSGWGYCSLRRVEVITNKGTCWGAGQGGYDNAVHFPSLSDSTSGQLCYNLVGFKAWVNVDGFINAFSLLLQEVPVDTVALTSFAGSLAPANNQRTFFSTTGATCKILQARWDRDVVRGVCMTLTDGTTFTAGDMDNGNLVSHDFADGETLTSMRMSSSGFGYVSLRQLHFTTSTGAEFHAGPAGIDDIIECTVDGMRFAGFRAWVNADNFLNALSLIVYDNVPFRVAVDNTTGWTVKYDDVSGVLWVDGREVLHIEDLGLGHNTEPGAPRGPVKRTARVSTIGGQASSSGLLHYRGDAQLRIAIFADATFEAKFSCADGPGYQPGPNTEAVYGALPGLVPASNKLVLLDVLVRKYAPVATLNADEAYWPSTVDAFLPHMQVHMGSDVIVGGPLDRALLDRAGQELRAAGCNSGEQAHLRTIWDLNEPSDTQDWMTGTKPGSGKDLTSYVVVVEGAPGSKKLDIVYWWFFPYNQGRNAINTSWGNHVADWCHVKVSLDNFIPDQPGQEHITSVMFDHHGDKDVWPSCGTADFNGRQVFAHMANGNHEIYPREGVYDRPMGTHDYCNAGALRFDQRQGPLEVYLWDSGATDFKPRPADAPPSFKESGWLGYRGRWGNWERGCIGWGDKTVCRLEKGPEGLHRPGEYEQPM